MTSHTSGPTRASDALCWIEATAGYRGRKVGGAYSRWDGAGMALCCAVLRTNIVHEDRAASSARLMKVVALYAADSQNAWMLLASVPSS